MWHHSVSVSMAYYFPIGCENCDDYQNCSLLKMSLSHYRTITDPNWPPSSCRWCGVSPTIALYHIPSLDCSQHLLWSEDITLDHSNCIRRSRLLLPYCWACEHHEHFNLITGNKSLVNDKDCHFIYCLTNWVCRNKSREQQIYLHPPGRGCVFVTPRVDHLAVISF